jgi:hypothetical protein
LVIGAPRRANDVAYTWTPWLPRRLRAAAWPWARRAPTEGRKETPAVGDLTAGALSRRSIRCGREGEPRRSNRLMRKHCVDNHRRLKFRRCDIFAKVRFSRRGGMSVRSALDASRMMRASRRGRGFRGRLDGLGGYAGLGRWYVRRDRRKRRGCCRVDDCRWWLRAVRQEVGIQRDQAERKHCPDHQEVFQDQHHCPSSRKRRGFLFSRATHLRGSFAAVWRYRNGSFSRLREEIGGRGFFNASADRRCREQPGTGNLANENPPEISPGGPTLTAPSLPPVHPRSEARARTTPAI